MYLAAGHDNPHGQTAKLAGHKPLRPAYALGEDRNTQAAEQAAADIELRPAYALGEDRNLDNLRISQSQPAGCARRTRWARIATRPFGTSLRC